jgi:formiminotetrahydrofolate cyclodeaminase
VLKAAQEAALHGNPSAVSDVRTGGAMAWAGLVGAAENVKINAGSLGSEVTLLGKVEEELREGLDRARALGLPL